jgi:hypothetical protein
MALLGGIYYGTFETFLSKDFLANLARCVFGNKLNLEKIQKLIL